MIRDAAVYMLNKLVMEPAGWEPFTTGYDLDDEDWLADVPVGAGVYVLYTPSHFYTLPGGATSVLYIGKASKSRGLRTRLEEHHTYTCETRDEVYPRGYARYEWMILHPARAAYVAAPDGVSSKDMEYRLLLAFADAFRVAPLGNAQSAWADEAESAQETPGDA